MRRFNLCQCDNPGPALRAAGEALSAGLLVAFPTDTVYGVGVDPRQEDAVRAVYEAKGRPTDKALPLLVASLDMALECVHDEDRRLFRLAKSFWPGPLTIVARATPAVPEGLVPEDGTIALRMPSHDIALALLRLYGAPLAVTSANRSGEPSLRDADAVAEAIGDHLAVLLDAPCGAHAQPSTVVSVHGDAPVVLREGAISVAMIHTALA